VVNVWFHKWFHRWNVFIARPLPERSPLCSIMRAATAGRASRICAASSIDFAMVDKIDRATRARNISTNARYVRNDFTA
jgi:hypothetical protein